VWTVGHSTHPLETFAALVRAHGVRHIADVRKLPRSRRHPQFNIDTLPADLGAVGIGYTHFAGLGGLRREQPDSINRAWKNPSFRAYADYMQTASSPPSWIASSRWGAASRSPSCAPRPCGGDATAR